MAQQNTPMPQTPPPKPQKSKTPPPPEAYAAFVRVYIEWMEKNEGEQIDLIERKVRHAKNKMNAFSGGMLSGSFGGANAEVLGLQFEEYVNTVWVEFTEECDNADEFAAYLQKDFEKTMHKYKLMQDNFLKETFAEWDKATANLEGKALDNFFAVEMPKKQKEFQLKKADFEKRYPGFAPLSTILRRHAQNAMSRRLGEISKASKAISLDDYDEEAEPIEIEDVSASGFSFEERLAIYDIIEKAMETLNMKDRKIFRMKMDGRSQTEIAKELGVSDATVSNRIKKILAKLKLDYENSN